MIYALVAAAAATAPQAAAAATAPQAALDVTAFWRAAGPELWFAKNDAFDRRFAERFIGLHEAAAAGKLADWSQTSEGSLALILLLDQFPRNAFRDQPRMYMTDTAARVAAARAIAAGHDRAVTNDIAKFFYLPFAHSEDLSDQNRSLWLFQRLGGIDLEHAIRHREIIRRFGRFPHRNPILARAMRPKEQRYLDEGGYRG